MLSPMIASTLDMLVLCLKRRCRQSSVFDWVWLRIPCEWHGAGQRTFIRSCGQRFSVVFVVRLMHWKTVRALSWLRCWSYDHSTVLRPLTATTVSVVHVVVSATVPCCNVDSVWNSFIVRLRNDFLCVYTSAKEVMSYPMFDCLSVCVSISNFT